MSYQLNPMTGRLELNKNFNFSFEYIIEGCVLVIPVNQQMIVHQELVIDGVLVCDGKLVML